MAQSLKRKMLLETSALWLERVSDPAMLSAFQAYFSQPMVAAAVIVHLVTDGTYYGDQKQETISVQLFDTKDQSHDLGEHVLMRVALGTVYAQGGWRSR